MRRSIGPLDKYVPYPYIAKFTFVNRNDAIHFWSAQSEFLLLGVYLVGQSKIQKSSTEELELEKVKKEAAANLLKPNEQGAYFGKSVFVNGHYGLKNPKKN